MAIDVVARSSQTRQTYDNPLVVLSEPSLVYINSQVSDVLSMNRLGNDLLIRLADGQTVRIAGYFGEAEGSTLVMDDRESQVEVRLPVSSAAVSPASTVLLDPAYQPISGGDAQLLASSSDSMVPVVDDGDSGFGTWAWVGGVAALTGIAVAAGGGGGGGGSSSGGGSGAAPTAVQAVDDSGKSLYDDSVTNDRTPTFQGRGEPGATIQVRDDDTGVTIASTQVKEDGTWSVILPQQALGERDFEVYQINGSQTREIGDLSLTFTDGPVHVGTIAVNGEATGTTSYVTDSTTLVLSGTLSEPLDPDEYAQISTDGGVNWMNLAVDGVQWSYTDPRVLTDGDYQYQVRVIDVDRDGSTEIESFVSQTVTVDTSASSGGGNVTPPGPVTVQAVDDSGKVLLDDSVTNDRTPTFQGRGEPGATIQIRDDNTGMTVASTQVKADGTWATTLPQQALGERDFEVYQINGSQTREIGDLSLTFTDGPVHVGTIAVNGEATGTASYVTDSTTLVLSGTLSEPLDPDEHAQISTDGGANWMNLAVDGVQWSYTDPRVLEDGDYQYRVRVIDVDRDGSTEIESFVSQTVTVETSAGNDMSVRAAPEEFSQSMDMAVLLLAVEQTSASEKEATSIIAEPMEFDHLLFDGADTGDIHEPETMSSHVSPPSSDFRDDLVTQLNGQLLSIG